MNPGESPAGESESQALPSGAAHAQRGEIVGDEVNQVIAAWGRLPAHIQTCILTLVEAAKS